MAFTPCRIKELAIHRRNRLNEANTMHQFLRDIDDEEAWIKWVDCFAVVHHVSYYVTFMVRWTVIDGKWAREPLCLNGHKIGHSPFCSFGSRLFWGVTCCKIVPSFSSFIFYFLFIPLGVILATLPGYGAAAARAELPIPISVCHIFVHPNSGMAASASDCFELRSQVLVHAIVHRGCTNTVGESAPIVDPARKVPSLTGESNSVLHLAFWLNALPTELCPAHTCFTRNLFCQGEEAAGGIWRLRPWPDRRAEPAQETQASGGWDWKPRTRHPGQWALPVLTIVMVIDYLGYPIW